jgi:hypothetical protein
VKIFFVTQTFTSGSEGLGSCVTTLMIGDRAATPDRWRGANRGRLLFTLLAFGSACLLGCGSDPAAAPVDSGGGTGGTGGSSGTGGTGGGRPTCPNPRIPDGELQNHASGPSVFGIVVGGDPGLFDTFGGTECGLPGVRICQRGTAICTDSDGAGQYVLGGLPQDQDMEIAFENPGSTKVIRLVHTGATPINLTQTRLIATDPGKELFRRAGVELDLTNKGTIVAAPIAAGDGIGGFVLPEGAVVTLLPSGLAPLYSLGSESANGLSRDELDPTLQAMRAGGWGIFPNVDPGDYAVRFERNGQPCTTAIPGYGYGADAEGNIRVKVVAGHSTGTISAFCQ